MDTSLVFKILLKTHVKVEYSYESAVVNKYQ